MCKMWKCASYVSRDWNEKVEFIDKARFKCCQNTKLDIMKLSTSDSSENSNLRQNKFNYEVRRKTRYYKKSILWKEILNLKSFNIQKNYPPLPLPSKKMNTNKKENIYN